MVMNKQNVHITINGSPVNTETNNVQLFWKERKKISKRLEQILTNQKSRIFKGPSLQKGSFFSQSYWTIHKKPVSLNLIYNS